MRDEARLRRAGMRDEARLRREGLRLGLELDGELEGATEALFDDF